MRCDVVAVGTELLLGQVVDTNSAWIGEHLALAGIDSNFQVKVGDNLARIVTAIREALARSDAVIVCGGLGPTQDDITREAIAEVMGVELVRDDAIIEVIRAMFGSRGREMPDNNLRQADVPAGATAIPNPRGTAPGLMCPVGDRVIFATPGVPHEMRQMMERAVIPELKARAGTTATILSPDAAHLGDVRIRPRRGGGVPARRPGGFRRCDHRVPGVGHRGHQGPGHGQGPGPGLGRSATRCRGRPAPEPARLDRLRRRRRDHRVRGRHPSGRRRIDPRGGRIGDRRFRRGPDHRRARCQRLVPRVDRLLRQRRQVRPARRVGEGRW